MKIDELVNKHYDKLNQNDLHIWKYINSHKEECCNLSIHELASRCNISKTTILRFAKKLSLKGYSELKVYLNWEMDVKEDGDIEDLYIDRICDSWKSAIDDIKERDFTDINEMIYKSKRVFVYGTGKLQVGVARELKRMFLYCGEIFYIVEGENEAEMLLKNLKHEDLVILISLTGDSEKVTKLAKELLVKNVPFISITKLKNNAVARMSTKSIYIATSKIKFGDGVFHEVSNLFFLLAEVLFLRYTSYKKIMEKKASN
ncbi:MAG: MurR/RpiR family transcriptional regulator [Terrisporobacter sp.]|uniref:MurR/RpiR family transcriptional regulator n=1 Tax=Terrisporobacter sp. TaxID=1965305 RepID=UPI002FC6E046